MQVQILLVAPMTKTVKLNKIDDYWYGIGGTKIVCKSFIETLTGGLPDKVTFVLSDVPVEGSTVMKVFRTGYYRWSWRLTDVAHSFFGMRRSAEDIIGGIFNTFDEKGNVIDDLNSNVGKEEQTIWITKQN